MISRTCQSLFLCSLLTSQLPIPSITWSRAGDMPLPRGGYYAAWYKGGLLIAGGTYWADGKKIWTDRVHHFDPERSEWSELPPLPRPLGYGGMVEHQGTLYLLGGCDSENVYGTVYRQGAEGWREIDRTPEALVYTAAVSAGPHIYLLGGTRSLTDLTQGTRQAWRYDVRQSAWQSLDPIPGPPRLTHSSAVVGPHIYVFGGATQKPGGALINLEDANRLDTINGTWTALRNMPIAARASWAVPVNGSVYLIGGAGDAFLDGVYRYDAERNDYRLVSRIPLPLADMKLFHHRGFIYGAGGEDAPRSRFSGTLVGRVHD